MKFRRCVFGVLFVAFLVTCCTYSFKAAAEPQQTGGEVGLKWEHRALAYSANLDKELSGKIISLGDTGWELVAVTTATKAGTTDGVTYYFKRPKLR